MDRVKIQRVGVRIRVSARKWVRVRFRQKNYLKTEILVYKLVIFVFSAAFFFFSILKLI